jgi:hypothetical protein
MALKRNLHLTRVRIIELISIAAGVATLFSAAQNVAVNNARITQSKFGHILGFKQQRRSEQDDTNLASYCLSGLANMSDQQFSAVLYQESSFAKNLPPLLQQLQTDMVALDQLRKDKSSAQSMPLINAAKGVVFHDKQAIVQLMIQDHVQMNEIIRSRQPGRSRQVGPSGS